MPAYNPTQFERPSVTVDVVVFTLENNKLKLLLIKRTEPPYAGNWAIPGGFVQIDESLLNAAKRKLAGKTGVHDVYLEQLYTFGKPDRDPRTRVITVVYFALIPVTALHQKQSGSDGAVVKWFDVQDMPALAFDHKKIVIYALQRLRYKLEYTIVGFELLPNEFTLTDLQRAYETVLGEQLDKRNFRRKILSAGIIKETGSKRRESEGRPAKLYRYLENAITEVKTRRLFP